MTDLTFNTQWAYRLGKPESTGQLKVKPEDFIVKENLGYELSEDGEHIFLWVEKQGLNTAYVAEALAKFTGLPLRQVTYAGRKDKHAITQQWFGLHAPKGIKVNPADLDLPGFKVLSTHKHHKKLKVGQLEGNHFSITLRNVTQMDLVEQRLKLIKQEGVPNYFGDQRFGVMIGPDGKVQMGGTLFLGLRMVSGEVIRNRNKRNMALSSLRSALFNTLVSQRITDNMFEKINIGDACSLIGSNSYFIEDGRTLEASQLRYEKHDISPTAPLVGINKNSVTGAVLEWENKVLSDHENIISTLRNEGLSSMRRAMRLWPTALEWETNGDKLHIQFGLPAGCFATSVLRECVHLQPSDDSGND